MAGLYRRTSVAARLPATRAMDNLAHVRVPVPDSESIEDEEPINLASGSPTPVADRSVLELPPLPESPLSDVLEPILAPPGLSLPADPEASTALVDTRTPTPPASGRASPRSELPQTHAESDTCH